MGTRLCLYVCDYVLVCVCLKEGRIQTGIKRGRDCYEVPDQLGKSIIKYSHSLTQHLLLMHSDESYSSILRLGIKPLLDMMTISCNILSQSQALYPVIEVD